MVSFPEGPVSPWSLVQPGAVTQCGGWDTLASLNPMPTSGEKKQATSDDLLHQNAMGPNERCADRRKKLCSVCKSVCIF